MHATHFRKAEELASEANKMLQKAYTPKVMGQQQKRLEHRAIILLRLAEVHATLALVKTGRGTGEVPLSYGVPGEAGGSAD